MTESCDWVLSAEVDGEVSRFAAGDLPLSIGGGVECDIRLHGISGSFQIGTLDGAFFVQPGKDTRGMRLDGKPVTGSRWLKDGQTVALDTARVRCRLGDGRLDLSIEGQLTGGDTAPPDLEELAREMAEADEVAVEPIAFRRELSEKYRPSTVRSRRTTAIVGSALAILATLGWFAFTAKSVELVTVPQAEDVGLPETLFKFRIGDRHLLRSGSHRVVARLAGYYPLDEVIEVGSSPAQTVRLELTKLPGIIAFSTEPEVGAEVLVDGESIGTAPLSDVEVESGRHRVEFVAERYLAEVLELDVIGEGQPQSLSAELTPNWAPVSVSSRPAGAQVVVDGTALGTTPVDLELEAGERELEFRLPGYNAWRDTITVLADQPLSVPEAALVQADGRVDLVTDPPGAAVSVNGEFRGSTPLTLRLAPGRSHNIALNKPGYEPATRELSVAADSGRRLEIPLVAQLGVIEVVSDPPAAEIYVDGEPGGATPARLTLLAVVHELEVRLEGHASQSTTVTPRTGFPQRWETVLEAQDTFTGAGYPRIVQTSLGQDLRLVLPGEFTIGSSRREQGRRSNEALRAIRLTEGFYLGVREVSNAEFRQFDPEHDSGAFSGVSLNDDEQPVVRVTWEQVAQFMNWLSIKDSLQPVYEEADGAWRPVRPLRNGYRLPTEAEWAWAARFAGREEPLIFAWGAALPPPDRVGNYADISARQLLPTTLVTYNDGFGVAAPSGSFPANSLGIFDLGGNVSEWVQDYYEVGRTETEIVAEDPLGPEIGRFHVVRGPSWRGATVTNLRMASRNFSAEGDEQVGFRIARNLE